MAFLIPHPINTAYARFPMPGHTRQQSFGSRFFILLLQKLLGQAQGFCLFFRFIEFALF